MPFSKSAPPQQVQYILKGSSEEDLKKDVVLIDNLPTGPIRQVF